MEPITRDNQNVTEFFDSQIEENTSVIYYKYSETERNAATSFLVVMLSLGSVLNTAVIYFTVKYRQLQEPYMFIRASYAFLHVCYIWAISIDILMGMYFAVTETTQCVASQICLGIFICTVYHNGINAYERYTYFCTPMQYLRIFNLKTIFSTTLMCLVLSQVISHMPVLIERGAVEWQPTMYQCLVTDEFRDFTLIIPYGVFLPTISVTAYSIYKIYKLRLKIHQSIVKQNSVNGKSTEGKMRKEVGNKALRLTLLVSGSFWGTYAPLFITGTALVYAGYTWEELNAGLYPEIAAILKTASLFHTVSVVIDPLIYFAVHRDLRVALLRVIGKHRLFTWQERQLPVT